MFVVLQDLFVFILGHHYLTKEKLERLGGFLGKRVTFLYIELMSSKRHKRRVVASFNLRDLKLLQCRVVLFSQSTLLKVHSHL